MNQRELELERELRELRMSSAKLVYALNCAIQLTEALIAFLPSGQVLHEGVVTAKHQLDEAMRELRK